MFWSSLVVRGVRRDRLVQTEATRQSSDLEKTCSTRMRFRNVMRILATPNQMAGAADQNDGPRVEEAEAVGEVVDVAAGTTANVASAIVMVPDRSSEKLPLVGVEEIFVSHTLCMLVTDRNAPTSATSRKSC